MVVPSLPSVQSVYVDTTGRPTVPFADFLRRLLNFFEDTIHYLALNVRDYGATGDGATNDTDAINDAEAARVALGVRLYFPAGVYLVDSLAAQIPRWYGDGAEATFIKVASGSSANYGVTVGDPTGSTLCYAPSLEGMTIDANSKCAAGAALLIRNVTHGRFTNLMVKSSAGHGLRTDSATTEPGGNTYQSYNQYFHIRSEGNTLDGFRWRGEHFSDFAHLTAILNRDNFVWENFTPDSTPGAAANEECTGTNLASILATRDGFRFDGVDKFVFGQISTIGCARYGVSFWYDSDLTGSNQNNIKIANYSSRNDAQSGLYVDPIDGGMAGATFGEVSIIGAISTPGTTAVTLTAAQNVKFGTLAISGWAGIGMIIQQGSPKGGGAAQSSNIQIGNLAITGCGHASHTSHGLQIKDTTGNVQIANLMLANSQTTGANFEIDCAVAVGLVQVAQAAVTAAAGGNEESNPGQINYAQKNF